MGEESSGWSVDQMKLGKGLVEGWFLLAKKLRTLGVSTPGMSKFFLVIPTLKSSDSVPLLSSLKGEFHLQRWGPEVGCFWNGSHAKEVWVRIVGLLFIFGAERFSKGLRRDVGFYSWREIRDKVVGGSRGESVWETQPVVQNLGLEEQFEYGRRNRSAVGAACRSAKGTVLDLDFLKPRFRTTGSAEKKGKVVLGSSEWVQEKPTGGAAGLWALTPSVLWTIVGAMGMEQVVLADEDFNAEGSLLVPSEDNLVLHGRKELPCVSVGINGAIELAIVPVGSVFARPLVEMIDFQLEEGVGRRVEL
ncbi:hypothetical protein AAG906_029729 [Vitis piasezkii]